MVQDELFSLTDVVPKAAADTQGPLELTPPPRFGKTSFTGYTPQHSSQQRAKEKVKSFARRATFQSESGFRWPWQQPEVKPGRGLYLDGGFGVGKTHLLAAAYHACESKHKAYLSFQELVYLLGVQGMATAKEKLAHYRLFCIDEFELDDPGNTLIVGSFLAQAFAQGSHVITTSNTLPEAQGQGRFNAEDFKREIQGIAERFEVVTIEGPDYRQRDHLAPLLSEGELRRLEATESVTGPKVKTNWPALFDTLTAHHPVHYRKLLENIGTLYIHDVKPIPDQNNALRFVHFIDKLYDLEVGLRASGELALEDIFDASYRHSAYAKKHYRCLSRLSELLEERTELAPA